jgi:uncharacterized coiled-coil DUF342 family protein
MTTLSFDVLWRDRGATRGMQKLGQETDIAQRRYAAFGRAAAVAGLVVAAAAVKFGKDSVRAYTEAQTSQVKLQSAFAKFPALADTNINALRGLNTELAKKTRFDDDATASGQAVLAQFKLTGQQITQLTPLLQDYAARTGKDLPSAATTLGKAVMGNGRALKAVGINFKDTGTEAGNFEQIVAGLRTQVGGFAQQEGKTAAGQIAILKNQFGELQEAVGAKLVPALSKGVGLLTDFVGFIDENKQVVGPLTASIAGIATSISLVVVAAKGIGAVRTAIETLGIGAEGAAISVKGLSVAVAGVGIALGVATIAIGHYAKKSAEAKQQTDSFTEALIASNGAVDDNVRSLAAKALADKGAFDNAQKLGLSLQDVTDAALGNEPAMQRVMAAVDQYAAAVDSADTKTQDQVAAANELADALMPVRQQFDNGKKAAGQFGQATGDSTKKVKDSREELNRWRADIRAAGRAALGLAADEDAVEAAVDDATQSIKDNGKTLDKHTDKGRNNRAALRNLANTNLDYIDGLVKNKASTQKVNKATDDARESFIKTAIKITGNRKEAEKLADKYGLVDRKINDLNSKKITITYKTNAGRLANAFKLGLTLNSGEQKGGSRSAVGNQAGGPTLTMSHGHGPASGGPGVVSPRLRGSVATPDFNTLTNRLGRGVGRKLGSGIGDKLDALGLGSPTGSVGAYSAGQAATIARLRAAGARSFTTYPGHHPSMAKARDVTPHNWKIANTARASSGVWYVIYQMKIASKNHGNVWRQYHPNNHRGDWQHRRHIHVAWYDRGGVLPSGGMAFNGSGQRERVLSPAQTRAYDRSGGGSVTYNIYATHYSDAQALKTALVNLNRGGDLDVIKR